MKKDKNNSKQDQALDLLLKAAKSNYLVAKETGISEATIGNYVNGKTKPTPANAKILVEYFSHCENEKKVVSLPEVDTQLELDFSKVVDACHKAADSCQRAVVTAEKLATSNDKLVDNNTKLIDKLLTSIDRLEKKIDQKGAAGDAKNVVKREDHG